jgi:hypothetical protein
MRRRTIDRGTFPAIPPGESSALSVARSPPEPSRSAQQAKPDQGHPVDRPRLKWVDGAAGVMPDGTFMWLFNPPDPPRSKPVGGRAPISSFSSFETGPGRQWFTALHEEQNPRDDHLVLVIFPEGRGVECVAAHAGTPAELRVLHETLTREFLTPQPALALIEKPRPPTDEVPTKL